MNRAVHGDVVAVELFPESEWKSPGDEVVDQECAFPLHFPFAAHIFYRYSNTQER